uniref:Nyctalopin n=1 Tax=Pavo cristatus TaxID=9049 RepID=A0A8C9EJW0_PAVCR
MPSGCSEACPQVNHFPPTDGSGLILKQSKAGLSLNISDSCPSMCKCAPEEVIHCNRAGLRALPGEIAASTVSLNLSNNYLRILTTNTFRNLTFLHSLWLDGNNLTFLSPGTFHALSKLRELDLSRNSRLTYLHANTFRGLLNLISLDLSHCNIFEIHPLLFSHLPSLERLNLASNNMRYVPQAFSNLSSLTRLSLESNHIERSSTSGVPVTDSVCWCLCEHVVASYNWCTDCFAVRIQDSVGGVGTNIPK